MGEPVGKASGRTFNQMSTHVSDPCRSALLAKSSHSLNNVNLLAFRSLGNRVTHVRLCTVRQIQIQTASFYLFSSLISD